MHKSGTMDDNTTAIENARPFRMRRVVRDESMISTTPSVVRCIWTQIKTENLNTIEGTIEEADSVKSCILHERCMGHLCVSPSNGAYLIPYGFAVGGEIVSSDRSLMNRGLFTGNKSMSDITAHCFKKIGLRRGSCASRTTGAGPQTRSGVVIQIPARVINRAVFIYGREVHHVQARDRGSDHRREVPVAGSQELADDGRPGRQLGQSPARDLQSDQR